MRSATAPSIHAGDASPLGAHWTGYGVNFALFSRYSDAVDLCLFDPSGEEETRSLRLPGRTGDVWHGYVEGLAPGQLYGYRVHGKYAPRQGHRFNKHKLLLDPYARAIRGELTWSREVFGYCRGGHDEWRPDIHDSARLVPRSVVTEPVFRRGWQERLLTPWNRTVIYELHVKGFTAKHPDVPEHLRGTYLGLAEPCVIEYLRSLGVTAVELLPCQAFVSEGHLIVQGLSNYWGYNPISLFAPHPGYAIADPVGEFRQMVKTLHEAGIEVILDVVFNHTAEGDQMGPTLCFRGIDNFSYYLLDPADRRMNLNYSGCGNSLDLSNPDVLQMVMDCLRYWADEMQVDGFRFDLATTLGRRGTNFDTRGGFFSAIHQDPLLSRLKMIAEPWDIGPHGYRLGQYPAPWSEWNDRYRETVRRYWRGDEGVVPELAERIAGSSDHFRHPGRHPWASINYAACHDGFTLNDVVSYKHKHNQANLEANHDGAHHSVSWNCGHEGPTDDPSIVLLRNRQRRNLLATVLLSQGVPMLQAGDEIGRTQNGNNNAYCQDNETSWLDWTLAGTESDLTDLVKLLIAVRRDNPVFRRTAFLEGTAHPESSLKDVTWFREDGHEMTEEDWQNPHRQTLAVLLDRTGVDLLHRSDDDRDIGRSFLLLFNAGSHTVEFSVPEPISSQVWQVILDTGEETATVPAHGYGRGHVYSLGPTSLALLCDAGRLAKEPER